MRRGRSTVAARASLAAPAGHRPGSRAADPTGEGDVPARLFRPCEDIVDGVLVWLHGGGWILGSPDGSDDQARALSNASDCAVLSVDYRLAPAGAVTLVARDRGECDVLHDEGERYARRLEQAGTPTQLHFYERAWAALQTAGEAVGDTLRGEPLDDLEPASAEAALSYGHSA